MADDSQGRNAMTSLHDSEPTPEFRARLEWQIATALRRESRFSEPVGGWGGHLRIATVLVAALSLGAAGGIASEHVQDARQRGALVEMTRSEEQLLRLRLELARAELERERRRFEIGTAGRESLAVAERQVRDMETALSRLRLDLDEIQATSAAPRNDLHAPLVGTRDYVRERLELQLESAERLLAASERELAGARERLAVGLASIAALQQAESQLLSARTELQRLRAMFDLRRQYLEGAIKAEALSEAARRAELTLQRQRAERDLVLTRERLDTVRRHLAVGTASQLDLERLEVELLEKEAVLKRIQQELAGLGASRR
jgi:hypothetical protein